MDITAGLMSAAQAFDSIKYGKKHGFLMNRGN
jgi:hypothetical protein